MSWIVASNIMNLIYETVIFNQYISKLITGKSLSEALIFASTNPQYDDKLFIELQYKFNTWKLQAQTWGEHVVYRNCFWHSEQFLYTICSPHVLQKEELLTKIYLYRAVGQDFSRFHILSQKGQIIPTITTRPLNF